jgi:transcriptional regulator with XRE-family HTH domain
MKGKYETWGTFLKKKREGRFRSAREFCCRVSVGISYPQYSRYEAGDQLPNLEQALQLCKFLEIPIAEGLLEWCRAQIADKGTRDEVTDLLEKVRRQGPGGLSESQDRTVEKRPELPSAVDLNDVIVFNRSHLKLFNSDALYRDIFTFVNSFAPEWIPETEISASLGIPLDKLEPMLEQLNDFGVLLVAGGKCRSAKSLFYFPDDSDFFELRNSNVMHNASAIIDNLKHEDLTNRLAFRGLLTRDLTTEQVDDVIKKIEAMINDIVGMPRADHTDSIYSLCLLMGPRFKRIRG